MNNQDIDLGTPELLDEFLVRWENHEILSQRLTRSRQDICSACYKHEIKN